MRYAIFSSDSYYAQGGWLDFVAAGDDKETILEQAREIYRKNNDDLSFVGDWVHVVDLEQLRIIAGQPGEFSGGDDDDFKDIPRLIEETK